MTHAQMYRIDLLCGRLACARNDFTVVHDPPDLPTGWVSATIGVAKGRPKTFDIDPNGNPHA